jgi:hypothetical protein
MPTYSNEGSLVQFKGTDMSAPITIAIAKDREWAKIMVDHLNRSFTTKVIAPDQISKELGEPPLIPQPQHNIAQSTQTPTVSA